MPTDPKGTPAPRGEANNDEPKTLFRYVGNGDYLNGVPTKDLTQADIDAVIARGLFKNGDSDDTMATLEASALYEKDAR